MRDRESQYYEQPSLFLDMITESAYDRSKKHNKCKLCNLGRLKRHTKVKPSSGTAGFVSERREYKKYENKRYYICQSGKSLDYMIVKQHYGQHYRYSYRRCHSLLSEIKCRILKLDVCLVRTCGIKHNQSE